MSCFQLVKFDTLNSYLREVKLATIALKESLILLIIQTQPIPFPSPSGHQQLGTFPFNLAVPHSSPLSLSTLTQCFVVCVNRRKRKVLLLAMATVRVFTFTLLFAVLFVQQCICTDPPASSPSPAPESGADVASPPPESPAPSPLSNLTSPPAPPLSDLSPDSSPAPSPVNTATATPAPAPNSEFASDISHESSESSKEKSSGGGMTGGKKAGIAVGVMAAVCFVGLGALVYKKRQQNIQRTQFGSDARREIL
ncbi:hypothetical protein K7X08_023247 [Anisodus acutangulus]|uniref:Uncharacterized protein n=1 Tax=Anisodus acutangulus TaxID=402998 RepID=A0A9Q1LH98_9SOLA|nr:hypothetical protein K7X08_023247 [Anisodus acutangulus]